MHSTIIPKVALNIQWHDILGMVVSFLCYIIILQRLQWHENHCQWEILGSHWHFCPL